MFLILGHSSSNLFLVIVVLTVTCFSSCWVLYGEQVQGGDGLHKSATLSSFIYATTVLKPYEWRYISGNFFFWISWLKFVFLSFFSKGFWLFFVCFWEGCCGMWILSFILGPWRNLGWWGLILVEFLISGFIWMIFLYLLLYFLCSSNARIGECSERCMRGIIWVVVFTYWWFMDHLFIHVSGALGGGWGGGGILGPRRNLGYWGLILLEFLISIPVFINARIDECI